MEVKQGDVFDAEIHEAITQIPAPSKKLKGKIIDTVRKEVILNFNDQGLDYDFIPNYINGIIFCFIGQLVPESIHMNVDLNVDLNVDNIYQYINMLCSSFEKLSIKKIELKEMPELELQRLAEIYEKRGLKKETALIVAKELTEKDALGAHIRDELGINAISQAKPMQAAFASGAAFTFGGRGAGGAATL